MTNKNKFRGFTLIELLAVFIVLAIIMSIVILLVTGLINDSKDKTIVVSAKNYANAINNHILSSKLKDFNIPDGTYRIMPDGNVCIGAYADGECDGDVLEIDFQKGAPLGGQVVINNRKVTSVINANFKGKTISYDFIKDKKLKNTTPELYDFAVTRYSNSVKLNFIALNAVKYTCEYGLQEDLGNKGVINSSKTECMINDLKPGLTYHYKVEITSSAGEKVKREGTVTTISIVKPQMSVAPAGFSLSKTVTVNFTKGELIEPVFYLYTTSQARTNSAVTTCGDDFEPGECDNTPTNDLLANHWYKLNSLATSINVIYDINTTLIAKVSDGRVTIATSQIVITNIDNEGPIVTVDDINYGENAYIHLHDDQSGIRYFAVTTSTNYPSLTSNTETNTGSSLNTWYPVPVTTEEIVTTFINLDAGEYYAWGKDNLGNTSYIKFEVKKLKDSFTITPVKKVYTGSPIPANNVVKNGNGEVTYKYYESTNCTGDAMGAPTNVGKYSVRVELSDTENYIGGSKCISHEITKATPVVTMSATEGLVAVGAQISFTIKANVAGKFTLTNQNNSIATVSTTSITAAANQEYTVTITGVHIGKDEVTIKFVPTDTRNYKNVENLKYTATVLESIPIPTAASVCKSNVIYNGEKQTIISSYVTGLVYLNEIQTNAGNYEVTIMIDPASSLMWSDKTSSSKKVTCTIKKAEDPITVTHKTVTYNKNKQEPTYSSPSGLTITRTYYSDSSCTTAKEPKDAGVYYAKATTPGNSNYNPGTMACTKAITINKVRLTPSATCENKTYDGTTSATCTISLATVLSGETVGTTKSCAFANATAAQNKTVTCSNIVLTGDYAKNYELTTTTATGTATINKQKVNKPRNVAISTAGNVTWDAPSPNNATGYQISIDGTNYSTATSGIDYLSSITASTGSRTVYVRAINSDTTNYDSPSDNATNTTTVYTLTINSNNTTYGTVNVSSYKVITGATYSTSSNKLTVSGKNGSGTAVTLKTVTATAKTLDGYKPSFGSWSSTSGTITSNTTVTANFNPNPNVLTVNYYANGATKNSSGQAVSELLKTETLNYDGTVGYQWPTDYADPYGYKLVRAGYTKDGKYHIGSGTSATTIPQDLVTSTSGTTVVSVAESLGVLSNLKAGNTTVNIYAGWTPNVLTVNYYANGATTNSSGQTVNELLGSDTLNYNGTVGYQWPTDYADPYGYKLVKTGHTKDGKYHIGSGTSSTTIPQDLVTSTSGTTVVSVAQSLGVLSNLEAGNTAVNIYAGWTPNTYTIKYDLNCGGSSSCSGKPADQTYTYATGQSINLSSTIPTRTGYAFKGWSLSSSATTASYAAGSTWGRWSIPTSGSVYTLYAVWGSSETPTVACSVSGTSATGTGTTRQAGYLVGATVTCTCTGSNVKPTSMKIDGSTVSTTSSNNGYTISATKTINSPGAINVSATCTNADQVQSPGETGTKYYYRQFQLAYKINGAEKIGSSSSNYNSSAQILMANNTWSDGGSKFTLPTVSRTSSFAYCGSACGALGWDLGSTEKTATFASGATVNMCTTGTSGCSETTKGSSAVSSGTIGLGSSYTARNIYAISWGRIAAPKVFTGSGAFPASYFYLTGEAEELLGSGQTTTNLEVAASHRYEYAVVYNTRRYAWATIKPSCGWIDGGPDGTGSDWQTTAHTGATYLRYTSADGSIDKYVVNGDETTPASAVGDGTPPPLGKVPFIPTAYSNYTNYGWWCETHGDGWLVTPNASGGTYTCSKCEQSTGKLRMQYGSRDNNNIGVPTRKGYTFLGWYNGAGNSAKMVYDSLGKAVKSGGYWNYPDYMQEYAIWVGLSNVNIYAHWEEMSSQLTYYTNGHGSISGTNPVTMKYTEATYAKSAPSATGYTFLKWCTKSDGTGNCFAATGQHESVIRQANTTSYLSSNMSLYAIWQANTTTIKFDRRTDQYHAAATQPNDVTATYGKSVTAPYCASDCTGWYTSSGSSGVKVFNNDGTPTSNSTYFSSGKWSYTGSSPLKLYAKYN